jgi:organic hydroperoxide reductase OsmC/OhrA
MQSAPVATLEQTEGYTFEVRWAGLSQVSILGDLAPPLGKSSGPNPEQFLAAAMGQCLSSTLLYSLQRARVPVSKLRTEVRLTVGKNEKGRTRVRRVDVQIRTGPLNPEDRGRFDQCVATFADFCTVSGAVKEGIPTEVRVAE